jgi:hypothetical protein
MVEVFLMTLYGKWLNEPIFGPSTAINAEDAVRRFLKYIEIDDAKREKLERRIFAK